jgi:A-kinase anchor protein 9
VVLEEATARLRDDLNKERGARRRLEDSVTLDEVTQLVVRQLHHDLHHARGQVKELEGSLERDRRKLRDIRAEYDHLKLRASVAGAEEVSIFRPPSDGGATERSNLRERNLELERGAAELELRAEAAEREARRLREEVARLEGELGAEREKGLAGMSQEQLARMRHINSFLEHNLRENGEMLASLGQLQAEKKEMKVQNWSLQDRLSDCVCTVGPEDRGKTLYGRYLRAESFRKALVWQKRYLVVLLCGEAGEGEPVLAVTRPLRASLGGRGRWRAAVHAVIAISRMK